MLLPAVVVMTISATVAFVAMLYQGDGIPFLLQVLTVIGQLNIPSYKQNKHLLINLLHVLSLASMIRIERDITF